MSQLEIDAVQQAVAKLELTPARRRRLLRRWAMLTADGEASPASPVPGDKVISISTRDYQDWFGDDFPPDQIFSIETLIAALMRAHSWYKEGGSEELIFRWSPQNECLVDLLPFSYAVEEVGGSIETAFKKKKP